MRPYLIDLLLLEPGGSNFWQSIKNFIKRSRDAHADEVMTAQLARLSAMATGSCLWLSVTVMSGSHVLFGSKIVSCSSAETLGTCLEYRRKSCGKESRQS